MPERAHPLLEHDAVLVAGIVVSAVGNELVIAHPGERLRAAQLVALVAAGLTAVIAAAERMRRPRAAA